MQYKKPTHEKAKRSGIVVKRVGKMDPMYVKAVIKIANVSENNYKRLEEGDAKRASFLILKKEFIGLKCLILILSPQDKCIRKDLIKSIQLYFNVF